MKNFISVLIISLIFLNNLRAQDESFPDMLKSPVITASPEIAKLESFLETPVGLYNGIPDISIPLYSIKEKNIEMPIVLRYHSSGIKVAEEATWVGLGWSLMVEGTITHSIVGFPDENEKNILSDFEPDFSQHFMDKGNITANEAYYVRPERWTGYLFPNPSTHPPSLKPDDAENLDLLLRTRQHQYARPDIYKYNFGQNSGEMYFDYATQKHKPSGNLKGYFDVSGGMNDGWVAFDGNGNRFVFNQSSRETTTGPGTEIPYYSSATWHLDTIVQVNGQKVIFSYTDGYSTTPTYSETYTRYQHGNAPFGFEFPKFEKHSGTSINNSKYLTSIETDKLIVEFELSDTKVQRADLESRFDANNKYEAKRINAIHVKDKISDKYVKSFYFYYHIDITGHTADGEYARRRLILDSIKEFGYTDGQLAGSKPAYKFSYDNTYQLPVKTSFSADHWGYYNGENNLMLIPNLADEVLSGLTPLNFPGFPNENPLYNKVREDFFDIGEANRGMSPDHAKAMLLNRIDYPTGGHTIYSFEPNSFTNYIVFSAAEKNNGSGDYSKDIVIEDVNAYSSNPDRSDPLYPDKEGLFQLYNFKVSFSKASDLNDVVDFGDFEDAFIRILEVDEFNNETEILKYTIGNCPNCSTQYFNEEGSCSTIAEYISILGEPNVHYIVEAFLPDIDDLMPQNGGSTPAASALARFGYFNSLVNNGESIGAGLRVNKIESYDGTNIAKTRIFSYNQDNGELSSGLIMNPVTYGSWQAINSRIFTCNDGLTIENTAFEVHMSSSSYCPISNHAGGYSVGYTRVEYSDIDENNNTNGKTVEYYRNNTSKILEGLRKSFRNIPALDNGLVDSVIIFSNDDLEPVKNEKQSYNYSTLIDENYYGVYIYDNYRGPDKIIDCGYLAGKSINQENISRYTFFYYPFQTTRYVKDEVIKQHFAEYTPTLEENSEIDYNLNGLKTEIQTKDSKNNQVVTNYYYPEDIPGEISLSELSMTQQTLDTMISRRMVNITLKIERDLNNKKEGVINGFGLFDSDKLILSSQKKLLEGSSYEKRISFDQYDILGNLEQFQLENDIPVTYLWAYNNSKPVAKIDNAAVAECYYESYEEESSPYTIEKHTGNNAFQLTSGNFTGVKTFQMSDLTSDKYILSAWIKTTGTNIDSYLMIKDSDYSPNFKTTVSDTHGEWQYFEVEADLSSGNWSSSIQCVIHNVSGDAILVDDVRFYPLDAQMTTYTYDPLIGVTSVSDANSLPVHYEYDAFGRLQLIKNHQGHVLEQHDYHYKNQ